MFKEIALVSCMAVPTLITILKRILKQPTAPFHEYHVAGEIESLLKDCPGVKLKRDKFGNAIRNYSRMSDSSASSNVIGAQLDQPGFVRAAGDKGKADWQFLGGVSPDVVAEGVKKGLRKTKGQLGFWNFPVNITKDKVQATACDYIVGCSDFLVTFWAL